jgi:hypothetical protein
MPSFMIIQTHKSRTPCPIRKLTSAQFCGNATYNTTNHSISNHVIRSGEFFQNNAPYIAGKATTYVLGTIKFIPSNVAQSIGIDSLRTSL